MSEDNGVISSKILRKKVNLEICIALRYHSEVTVKQRKFQVYKDSETLSPLAWVSKTVVEDKICKGELPPKNMSVWILIV